MYSYFVYFVYALRVLIIVYKLFVSVV